MKDSCVDKNKRIVKNTILLYVRMGIMIIISLFTARVILNALGVEDYGIYNVIGGLVSMFSIISGSLSAATSRFITVGLGKGNPIELRKTFSATVSIHILLALILVILLETIGVWFLNNHMNIPIERMSASNWVFQCSIGTFVLSILCIPYNASIIAHEKMSVFAFMAIFDAIFKLFITIILYYYGGDKLILLAVLWLFPALITLLIYWSYCKRKFEECHYIWDFEKVRYEKIFSFAGWNFIGASSAILRDQGVNILLNIFCGPVVNAARGVTTQINSVVTQFANNFTMALNPQIMKSFAKGDLDYTFKLVFQGARFSCYLLLLISIPALITTKDFLILWLNLVPEHTVIFVRLVLIYTIIEAMSFTMVTLMLATGKIRNYQLIVGGCQMLNFPVAYLALRLGMHPFVTYLISIVIALMCLVMRLIMLHKMVKLPVVIFLKSVTMNILGVGVLSFIFSYLVYTNMTPGLIRFVCCVIFSLLVTGIIIYYIGCTPSERKFMLIQVRNRLKHENKQVN
ncbi:oligosaccharide flippase family protein [uncultured Coprobacter sp.]|jgi:O-antigen/teichoic acid export membrane protein|uniref:lipopolysaccharide biosynthesis protein n=1 Tax=uncultured Coprobacter sp. TaxID=1720550 RepID=UPI00259444B0|nr:oligosaccharide flippase family protein [uncultured Coprobacter sp.]